VLDFVERIHPRAPGGSKVRPRDWGRRHFLLVSGPFGSFSRRLARRLRDGGARCSRVILNAGDFFDWGFTDGLIWRGGCSKFDGWLDATLERESVTDVVIYGDANPYCAAAQRSASARGLAVHVLEQGYFRPFWVTLVRRAADGRSCLPRDPALYRQAAAGTPEPHETWLPPLTPKAARNITLYHAAELLGRAVFKRYRPPYAYSPLRQGIGHARRYFHQKLFRGQHSAMIQRAMRGEGPLFLGLLQRPGDSQLRFHSRFGSVAQFIGEVVESFAVHAPADARLLFKSHPLDHGLEPHGRTVAAVAVANSVNDRVFFIDEGDLNALIPAVAGAVTVNSTAGLALIGGGAPTIVLGEAVYDMEGLTHQGGLDRFWTTPQAPEPELYAAFRRVAIDRSQISGAFADPNGAEMAAVGVARRLLGEGARSAKVLAACRTIRSRHMRTGRPGQSMSMGVS
jgi:capsular polysaccharide export protein